MEALGILDLDVSANMLLVFPHIVSLQRLAISENNISMRGEDLIWLENLEVLEVQHTGELMKTTKLDLATLLQRPVIPKFVFAMKWIQELSLANNNLSTVDERIGMLSQLKVLNLSYNQIEVGSTFRSEPHC